jgi:hypothetical protein
MKGFDAKTQVCSGPRMVAGGIHGLAIVPINHPDVVMLLDELAVKNIPVITFNTDLTDGKRLGFVGNDYWRSGATAAGVLRLLSHHEADPCSDSHRLRADAGPQSANPRFHPSDPAALPIYKTSSMSSRPMTMT